ncbi:hypothetical protein GIB67_023038 [Kingdonia uniflora]|uniref:BTB/POZ domain-containing protein n=1 Tax=Kingdonia uniflora TaxID=39325 RepID=A0A7J7P2K3_9MAGN|nr:hypothetical protein GIB67_023038 [Kingdonia uniflora]
MLTGPGQVVGVTGHRSSCPEKSAPQWEYMFTPCVGRHPNGTPAFYSVLLLAKVLPKLSSPTLHALLTSDELWVPSEEKRFELALDTLLAKGALLNIEFPETGGNANLEMATGVCSDSHVLKGDNLVNNNTNRQIIEGYLSLKDGREGHKTAHNILVELAESVVDFHIGLSDSKPQKLEARYPCKVEQSALSESSFANQDGIRSSCSYNETQNSVEANRMSDVGGVAMEGPSEGNSCYNLNNSIWLPREQSRLPNEWGKCGTPPSWGGRTVGRRQVKNCAIRNCGVHREEYDSFINIFEGGSVLYCNMSFESLLSVRRQLEELGFPCKAVNDGLWLQTLLNHRVQEVAADTCKNCCLTSSACVCRQSYGFSQGVGTTGYYVQEHDRNNPSGNMGNIYVSETAPQSEVNGYSRPVRVHVRGPIDGLAGIGRGTTLVQANAWPPTRFVFSRVPFGLGNRNCQLSLGNDDSEARVDLNGESSGDGLTALVELSQGGRNGVYGEQERGFDPDSQTRFTGAAVAGPSTCGVAVQMLEAQEQATELEWQNTDSSSINLDMKTPLFDFPPFRFGVEFEGVHRLYDAHVKHSPEVFYAGSFWKISIQAFNDEDPQGRRTLGLFLHRRKAEITDPLRKVHMYVDCREKVTARYELICPSKREITVFGRDKEEKGTLLPKAPKGWGWRTALYFDELSDLLQGGALRVAAVVQLV